MHNVEVSKHGVDLGRVSFRGIEQGDVTLLEPRRFRCSPKDCVPKSVVKKIADRLAFGVIAGQEDSYDWHT